MRTRAKQTEGGQRTAGEHGTLSPMLDDIMMDKNPCLRESWTVGGCRATCAATWNCARHAACIRP